ncbi:MAG: DUF2066 domain-containing protein [Gammaproteobacteria bacterium]
MESRLPALLRGMTAAVVLAGALCARESPAVTMPNLYRVSVAPDTTAPDQRAAAIKAAMGRLLIRVTGDRNAPFDPALQTLLADAGRYLASYGLDRQGQAQVGFSATQVDQALAALQKPVWGPERPLTLIWIAVDDGAGGRALLGANDTPALGLEPTPAGMTERLAALRKELLAVADERGLPVTLPLLDLQDLNAVTFADVWGGFEDRVAVASARYRADAMLIGRVRPGVVGSEIEWLLVTGAQRQALEGLGLRDGLDAAGDRFAEQFATVGGGGAAAITVLNVQSSADYGRVVSYLEQQSALQSVDVDSFDNGVLNLRVTARADAGVLGRILTLGGVLKPAAGERPSGALVFEIARNGVGQ